MSFINKMDRDGREALDLLDEIESVLGIECAPITWPIGMGRRFLGVYHLLEQRTYLYNREHPTAEASYIGGLDSKQAEAVLGDDLDKLREEIELVSGASNPFDAQRYLRGEQTPVFFGSAINNFGVQQLLDAFVEYAPPPQPRDASARVVEPAEGKLTGFVFKIQANMDPGHRDRIAFMRICSGRYAPGMRLFHVRLNKEIRVADAITFLAADRQHAESAAAGDIIGLHNHGTINIGDTFSQGERLVFGGIPNFAPELFRRAVLKDPLRLKALQKGLAQLCEEGATQLYRPLANNNLILGAVGPLQFDVVAFRLKDEYGVDCMFETVKVATARWVRCEDAKRLAEFKAKNHNNVAVDHAGLSVYLASSQVNLTLTQERWPEIEFLATRDHADALRDGKAA